MAKLSNQIIDNSDWNKIILIKKKKKESESWIQTESE